MSRGSGARSGVRTAPLRTFAVSNGFLRKLTCIHPGERWVTDDNEPVRRTERLMKRKHEISQVSRFLQRNPAWSQVICVVGVALLIILGPIFMYGLLFHAGSDTVRMLFSVPWWPVVLLVALIALLSLLHGNAGVSVQRRSVKQQDAEATADSEDPPGPSSSRPPGPPGPGGSSQPPGPPGQDSDTIRCTMHGRTLNSLSGVDTNP